MMVVSHLGSHPRGVARAGTYLGHFVLPALSRPQPDGWQRQMLCLRYAEVYGMLSSEWPRRPRFLRCVKATSSSRMLSACFKPLISASRRALRSSYVPGFAMQRSLIFPKYSMTALSSASFVARSADNSPSALSSALNSAVLYLTS